MTIRHGLLALFRGMLAIISEASFDPVSISRESISSAETRQGKILKKKIFLEEQRIGHEKTV